jgi:hypothetical protein
MRPWIEHLFSSTAAYADFLSYMTEINDELTKLVQNELTGNTKNGVPNPDLATKYAFELEIYRKIFDKFKRETKEHLAQVSHDAKIKGA